MKRFKKILFVVEAGQDNAPALERAVALAENNQATLTVVDVVPRIAGETVFPSGVPTADEVQAAMDEEERRRLDALIEPFRGRWTIEVRVLRGTPFLEVIREVLRSGHDLVVKPPEDPDWLDRIFGGDDMHLLRKCPCPVWMVKTGKPHPYRRILAAVDVDEARPEVEARRAMNLQILAMAGSLALAEFAELHVVHAWEAIGESTMRSALVRVPEAQITSYVEQTHVQHRRALDALLQAWRSERGADAADYLKPQTHLVRGWPSKEIPAIARDLDVDLIVMGTVARAGVPGFFMGNTAETILGQIGCSVLAIKPPGFTTPVTLEEG